MLFIVIGPPASGKSTWVKSRATPGDIVIDYDAIAKTLNPSGSKSHEHPAHIRAVTKAARSEAIRVAVELSDRHNVYLIHSTPSVSLIDHYRRHGAHIIVIDPGKEVVLARAKQERPWRMQRVIEAWYRDQEAGLLPTSSKPTPANSATPSKVATVDRSRNW